MKPPEKKLYGDCGAFGKGAMTLGTEAMGMKSLKRPLYLELVGLGKGDLARITKTQA